MTDLNEIRARIRKLREMTTANGCTEAEAMNAIQMAMQLMDKYGLSESEVIYEYSANNTFAGRRTVADSLWGHVAFVCGCVGYTQRKSTLQMVYFGEPSKVMVAEYLHDVLRDFMIRETKDFRKTPEYKRRRNKRTRSASVKAFQQSMVNRLCGKLNELWWLKTEPGTIYENYLENWRADLRFLDKQLHAQGVKLKDPRKLKLADRRFDDARHKGSEAGNRAKLDPAMNSQGSTRLIS